jgi:hypothetical protein
MQIAHDTEEDLSSMIKNPNPAHPDASYSCNGEVAYWYAVPFWGGIPQNGVRL